MGNCFSVNDAASLRDMIGRADADQTSLTAQDIEQGLAAVAAILHKGGHNVRVVAVGGAVNTLLMHSRETTSDVDDFYSTKTRNPDVTAILKAAERAANKNAKLPQGWLNNHTAVFMGEGQIAALYNEAIVQGDVVFGRDGLTIYAVPWRYAFMTKLDRLGKSSPRPYDLTDALDYLAKHIAKARKQPIAPADIKKWAVEFALTSPSESVINEVRRAYAEKYGGTIGIE